MISTSERHCRAIVAERHHYEQPVVTAAVVVSDWTDDGRL